MESMNRGQQRLLELTSEHGAGTKCAEKAGVKLNQISQWCRGTKPDAANRIKLARKLRIPMPWWDEPVAPEASTGPEAA
jgi:transcriptional regulator with XRE-family HTH domain